MIQVVLLVLVVHKALQLYNRVEEEERQLQGRDGELLEPVEGDHRPSAPIADMDVDVVASSQREYSLGEEITC